MTRERYVHKECARIAVAADLGIPYTFDLNKPPEADLLGCGPLSIQVILAETVGSKVTFDPCLREGDVAVFFRRVDDACYVFEGCLWNSDIDATKFWREGAVPAGRLLPMFKLEVPDTGS